MTYTYSSSIEKVESMIGRSVRRDISRMLQHAKGGLASAVQAILEHPNPHVGIVTGFYIEFGEPPSPETDGLGGTAHMAAALAAAGIAVTVITDAPCAKAVWAIVDAIPEEVDLEVVAVSEKSVRRLRKRLEDAAHPLTHLIAIERVSPGSDGKPHREHGWDMTRQTAPLHLLFDEGGWNRPWTTIGIGDGGNEIGMGSLPQEIIDRDIPNGALIAATTPTDHLIVAGVSTWGGYGVVAALALASKDRSIELKKYLNRPFDLSVLKAAVEIGQATDDSRVDRPGTLQMSVDRLGWEEHAVLIDELRAIMDSVPVLDTTAEAQL
ncbi:MAG: DUF4392 domain-containing protein [Polaromonas sp.]|nr:DUF4392 domain-containing protein [Polaromonas sp.]